MNRIEMEHTLSRELVSQWAAFVIKLPKDFDVANAIEKLEQYQRKGIKEFKLFSENILAKANLEQSLEQEDGMNSPGILWDRITILHCKKFFTAPDSPHFKPQLHSNITTTDAELESVMRALNQSNPARNILLAKEATERQKETPELAVALWNLQSSNLAMWINQDLLYTVNIKDVKSSRLREYIKFFSVANKIRNTAIEQLEIIYHNKMSQRGKK